jgi:hypothetical protein
MAVPAEVLLGCSYAFLLVALASWLQWGGRWVRQAREGLWPCADVWTLYLGLSTALLLGASVLLVILGWRHASLPVLVATAGPATVIVCAVRTTWRRWASPS